MCKILINCPRFYGHQHRWHTNADFKTSLYAGLKKKKKKSPENLLSKIFYCFWMFVNKHSYIPRNKQCDNAKP